MTRKLLSRPHRPTVIDPAQLIQWYTVRKYTNYIAEDEQNNCHIVRNLLVDDQDPLKHWLCLDSGDVRIYVETPMRIESLI